MKKLFTFGAIIIIISLFAWSSPRPQAKKVDKSTSNSPSQDQKKSSLIRNQTLAWYRFFKPQEQARRQEYKNLKGIFLLKDQHKPEGDFLAFQLYNFSDQVHHFPTQDGSLLMIQEALDPEGKWKAIEYWDHEWGMGESVNTELNLQVEESVRLIIPTFNGDYKTKLRLRLVHLVSGKKEVLFSEEFAGQIFIEQFDTPQPEKSSWSYLEN